MDHHLIRREKGTTTSQSNAILHTIPSQRCDLPFILIPGGDDDQGPTPSTAPLPPGFDTDPPPHFPSFGSLGHAHIAGGTVPSDRAQDSTALSLMVDRGLTRGRSFPPCWSRSDSARFPSLFHLALRRDNKSRWNWYLVVFPSYRSGTIHGAFTVLLFLISDCAIRDNRESPMWYGAKGHPLSFFRAIGSLLEC
ncbi:uncharacterized protein KD926_002981 [Aspergillus affinis]|uniref:uncharacterized protein n=1 Tax=Aspergillus affinis TaxID=1070780 RepID=UPI0022FDD587|nr:uncharacterized protein KD926_002981 [Aspergillus affinis]KAI9035700.1 hypothetical protein KD926_002981 [Aspergillus affinis]